LASCDGSAIANISLQREAQSLFVGGDSIVAANNKLKAERGSHLTTFGFPNPNAQPYLMDFDSFKRRPLLQRLYAKCDD
jgi:hypothetical protein